MRFGANHAVFQRDPVIAARTAHRRQLGEGLDGQTAEIRRFLVPVADPYRDFEPVPSDAYAWFWFAKSPGFGWLLVDRLPADTQRIIQARIRRLQDGDAR